MSFEDDLAAAKASGEPFGVELDMATGEQSIRRYSTAERAAIAAKAQRYADRQDAEQAVIDARLARLRAAVTPADIAQFIEDELL